MGTFNIAQLVERPTSNREVTGSTPVIGDHANSSPLAGNKEEAHKRNVDKFLNLNANQAERGQAAQNHPVVCHVSEMMLVPFLNAAFSGRMQRFGGRL